MKNGFELKRIIDVYIDRQLKKPISINKKEKKVYTKKEFDFFKENGLNYFNRLVKYSESFMNYHPEFGLKIYSRTQFFSMCFYEIAKYSTLEEIEQEITCIKLMYINNENFGYINMAIDTLAANTIKIKKNEIVKKKLKGKIMKKIKL